MENAASIVSKFGQLLIEELQEIRGVGDKIVHLRDELATMNAVLRMLSEADEASVNHLVREWAKQVRELASDSEDCIDIFKLRVSRPLPRLDPGTPLNRASRLLGHAKLLPDIVKYQCEKLLLQRTLAADLQALLARMAIINERRTRYGVDREALRRSASFAPVSSASLSARALRPANDPEQFIGMMDQVNTLAEKLKSGDGTDIKVFSIVGFGGLGKTTLAMEVCRKLEVDFQHQAQVSVSQAFDAGKDLERLLKRMLHQLVKPKSDNKEGIKKEDYIGGIDNMGLDELTSTLQTLLRDKRYLIVIDDVWTIPAWDAIRSILPRDNNHSSRIIVTTRVESVTKACSSVGAGLEDYFVHHMKRLDEKMSEKLFINRVFGSNGTCPEDLEHSMEKILMKCGGLPLAIVSLASVLASYKSPGSKEMWDKICNSIGSQLEINPTLEGMREIVTLSYSHLPHHLKACMMYLSLFPEDYEIQKKQLLRRWIAEGFVFEKRGLTLQEVTESYFDELMSRNMIDPANISYDGRVKTCRVHDMMLEVMVSKSQEANFVSLVGSQCDGESHGKIRRLSIQSGEAKGPKVDDGGAGPKVTPSEKRTERRGIMGPSVKHVRSLSSFHPGGHHLLERLDEFTLLRVLDLEDCKAVEDQHMNHVCQMFLLKFLNLNGTDITVMPDQNGELVHLQTLSLRNTLLEDLPESVTNLERLEFLYFSHREAWDINWILPHGVGRMKVLRVVHKSTLHEDAKVAEEIGELTQLSRLTICLCCSQQVLEVLAGALSKTQSLRTAYFIDHDNVMRLNLLLEINSPPPLLRSLSLNGDIDRIPTWFESQAHLVKIFLGWTTLSSEEILCTLCKLPNLLNLTLWRSAYTETTLVVSTRYRFPVLKNLSVTSDRDEQKEIIFQEGSMAMLEKLEVSFNCLEKRISGIEHLPSLKEVLLTGTESNDSLNRTVAQLKSERARRLQPKQF